MRPGPGLALPLLPLLLAPPLGAQVSEMATARQLAIQGIDAVEGGDCQHGSELLERAEQLYHASVHLQYLARCHAREGRLVAATELWRRIVREGAPPSASPAVKNAVVEATAELERSLPRLGTATVRTAVRYDGLQLTLDGRPLSSALVDAPQVVDPGNHRITAAAPGFLEWSKDWTVAEGASVELYIELAPDPSGPAPQTHGGGEGAPDVAAEKSSILVPAGFVTGAVGAAALVGGTVTLLMRNNKHGELEDNCPNDACPDDKYTASSLADAKSDVKTLSVVSTTLFVAGGALLAGGITMVVLGSSESKGTETALVAGAPLSDAGLSVRGTW